MTLPPLVLVEVGGGREVGVKLRGEVLAAVEWISRDVFAYIANILQLSFI